MRKKFTLPALVFLMVTPALADTAKTTGDTPESVCIRMHDIDRTTSPDDKTILFHMKHGKVWRNALVSNCPLLSVKGFSYSPMPSNEICGSMQSIRVLEGGSVCLLGPFTQETPVGTQ